MFRTEHTEDTEKDEIKRKALPISFLVLLSPCIPRSPCEPDLYSFGTGQSLSDYPVVAGSAVDCNKISGLVVDCAYRMHSELGPGLLESVYEAVFADTLKLRGLRVERQCSIPIQFGGRSFDEGFRADLLVEDEVIVEIKSVDRLARVHRKQLLTYLKLSGLRIGLLVNFGGALLKGNIERLVVGAVPDLLASRD